MFKDNKNKKVVEDKGNEMTVEGKVDIYVMPKGSGKMSSVKNAAKASKGGNKMGVLIFIFGGLILVGLSVFLYFYLLKDNGQDSAINKDPVGKVVEPVIGDGKGKEPVATTSKKIIETPVVKPKRSIDTDGDGLFDLEEKLLGTNKDLKDSDKDSFDDYSEVLNGYNPAGDGKIVASTGLKEYENNKYKYSMIIPSAWKFTKVDGEKSISIESSSGQKFLVQVSLNYNKQSIENWYKAKFDVKVVEQKNKLSISGVDAIKKDDKTVYMSYAGNIYNITYLPGKGYPDSYINIFNVLLASYKYTNI